MPVLSLWLLVSNVCMMAGKRAGEWRGVINCSWYQCFDSCGIEQSHRSAQSLMWQLHTPGNTTSSPHLQQSWVMSLNWNCENKTEFLAMMEFSMKTYVGASQHPGTLPRSYLDPQVVWSLLWVYLSFCVSDQI